MGTAKKGAVDGKAAQSIREATMYSLIKVSLSPTHPPTHSFTHPPTHPLQQVNKGARASNAEQASEGVNELKTNPPTHPPTHPLQQVNKGARASNAEQASEGVNELKTNLKAFLALEWKEGGGKAAGK